MNIKLDIYKFLEVFPGLKQQYVFYNCFIISSKKLSEEYEKAKSQKEKIKCFDEIEIYFTPNYLYEKDPKNEIFNIITQQKEPKFYFLKEHIFYYKFLLKCLDDKKKILISIKMK